MGLQVMGSLLVVKMFKCLNIYGKNANNSILLFCCNIELNSKEYDAQHKQLLF